ncbi:hypothetical protein SCLCIDRAFT_1224709 [Scleroderma citrinum Foug A]|uniref:Uncharacterized protein n=1 Tax=Scleroderma citrinum Foug A TaxID=1036808 RepID=A0A0C3D497_9AGAM|nr:hypothetical protein SCLCIDRAFT_1224709 [Scleroderma citrinum Foug A]
MTKYTNPRCSEHKGRQRNRFSLSMEPLCVPCGKLWPHLLDWNGNSSARCVKPIGSESREDGAPVEPSSAKSLRVM